MPAPGRTIMFYLDCLAVGGVERVTLNLLAGLMAEGWQVSLALNRRDGALLAELPAGVTIHDLDAGRFATAVWRLRRLLGRARPAIVVSQRAYLNIIASLAVATCPRGPRLMLAEHSILSLEWHFAGALSRVDRLARLAMPIAYRLPAVLVGVSEAASRDIERLARLPAGRAQTLYNPVIGPRLAALSASPVDVPWPDDGTPVVMAVGRLTPDKGLPDLVAAVASLHRERPIRLALVGDGPERSRLEAEAAALGLPLWVLGYQANPFAWMARADVLALSSLVETFPSVLIEAMAVGTPVVTVDCPHGPREIVSDGVDGLLVPPGDPRALAAGLARVLDDPALAARLREGGRLRAQAFTEARRLGAYAALFEAMLAGQGRRLSGLPPSSPSPRRSST